MTLKTVIDRLLSKWFVCRITSSRKSAQYGIRFSYPLYISLVTLGILLANPYIVSITALIAFLGVILPMHPFDYVYNYGVTKLFHTERIPGRGSELQINSSMTLLFNLGVITAILSGIRLNYEVMAFMYVLSSVFFIVVLLVRDDFSLYSIFNKVK